MLKMTKQISTILALIFFIGSYWVVLTKRMGARVWCRVNSVYWWSGVRGWSVIPAFNDIDVAEHYADSNSALSSKRDEFSDDSSEEDSETHWSEDRGCKQIIHEFLAFPKFRLHILNTGRSLNIFSTKKWWQKLFNILKFTAHRISQSARVTWVHGQCVQLTNFTYFLGWRFSWV